MSKSISEMREKPERMRFFTSSQPIPPTPTTSTGASIAGVFSGSERSVEGGLGLLQC